MKECNHIVGFFSGIQIPLSFLLAKPFDGYFKYKFCPECEIKLQCKFVHVYVDKIKDGKKVFECYKCGQKLNEE